MRVSSRSCSSCDASRAIQRGRRRCQDVHEPGDVLMNARIELARFPLVLDAVLNDLDTAAWRARPAAAEWAPIEIVCHLRDEEVEDSAPPPGGAGRRPALHSDRPGALGGGAALSGRRRPASTHGLSRPPGRESRLAGRRRAVASHDRDRARANRRALGPGRSGRLGRASTAPGRACGRACRTWATRWAPLHTEYAGPIPYADG